MDCSVVSPMLRDDDASPRKRPSSQGEGRSAICTEDFAKLAARLARGGALLANRWASAIAGPADGRPCCSAREIFRAHPHTGPRLCSTRRDATRPDAHRFARKDGWGGAPTDPPAAPTARARALLKNASTQPRGAWCFSRRSVGCAGARRSARTCASRRGRRDSRRRS